MLLREVVTHIGEYDPELTIYVTDGEPWSLDIGARLAVEPSDDPTWKPSGFRYFLEVQVAQEVADDRSDALGRPLDAQELGQLILYYAEHDAYPPVPT